MFYKKFLMDKNNELFNHLDEETTNKPIQIMLLKASKEEHSSKVVIDADEYFNLLTLKDIALGNDKETTEYSPEEMKKQFEKIMKEAREALENHKKNNKQGLSIF